MRMQGLALMVLVLLATAPPVAAQGAYINDVVQVSLRTGPGYDHKVVAVLRSGDLVEIVEAGGEWSRVRTPEGSQGWVLARLLTDRAPNVLKLKRLERELEAMRGRSGEPGAELSALLEEKMQLQNTLDEVRFELEALRQAYAGLEKAAREDETHLALASARKQLDRHVQELAQCRRQAAEMVKEKQIRWFLAGAGILLTGLLIGMLMRRRQRSTLY